MIGITIRPSQLTIARIACAGSVALDMTCLLGRESMHVRDAGAGFPRNLPDQRQTVEERENIKGRKPQSKRDETHTEARQYQNGQRCTEEKNREDGKLAQLGKSVVVYHVIETPIQPVTSDHSPLKLRNASPERAIAPHGLERW